jgi:hypothetical protein
MLLRHDYRGRRQRIGHRGRGDFGYYRDLRIWISDERAPDIVLVTLEKQKEAV